ncbi:Rieske (2Fe-2S) protein [Afifella pfennigii]|uniref:Rieske (2Fe-2S) protein n=1 Tax=Afifella pfennigii TaxID=209897 RepID=UPI00047CDB73|nr:Rieske 2Fe-2S domain-containing protein [Afifella pfennigii]
MSAATRYDVCAAEEVRVGALTPVPFGRATLVLTRLPCGSLRALAGRCPHQGAALQFGCVTGLMEGECDGAIAESRAGEVLRCPWHGFEFDLASGEPVVAPPAARRMRLRFFDVSEEAGRVIVSK